MNDLIPCVGVLPIFPQEIKISDEPTIESGTCKK